MLDRATIDKMRNPGKLIPPAPHYPYWRLFCPDCQQWWESELYRYHYVVPCPDCQVKSNLSLNHQ